MLLLGKSDGTIDAWDFCEQSHGPATTFSGASCAITSMKFSRASEAAPAWETRAAISTFWKFRGRLRDSWPTSARVLEFLKRSLAGERLPGSGGGARIADDFDAVGDAASELESVAVPLGDGKPAPAPAQQPQDASSPEAMDDEYKNQLEAEERRYKRLEERFRKQHELRVSTLRAQRHIK